jgi:putative tricarboxylic transport membrane protein
MKTQDLIGSFLWLLTGSYVTIHAYGMGLGNLHSPGAGFIFFLAALLLVILSVVDLIGTFRRTPEATVGKEESHVWSGVRWKKLLMLLGGIAVYVYVFNFLGFATSTFLLMVLLFKGVEPTRWSIAVASSMLTTVFSYLIFKMWLGVSFPTGILGI